jgi:hypothetical protein
LWPSGCAVDVPTRLVSDEHAHASPAALRVRQPCGAAVLDDDAAGVAEGAAGVVGAGVVGAGCVVGGGVVVGGAVVDGGVCCGVVCAKLTGAAIRNAALARMMARFMTGSLVRAPEPQRAT